MKLISAKNIGWLSLLIGLALFPLALNLDARHGIGQWLDTMGNPTMFVDDPGDGNIFMAVLLSLILYCLGYFLTLRFIKPGSFLQRSLIFVGGLGLYYFLSIAIGALIAMLTNI